MTDAVVVVGGGGHARVCVDVLLGCDVPVMGYTDPDPPRGATRVPYLGTDDELGELVARGVTSAFVALGDNAARARCTALVTDRFALVDAIAPSAVIAADVTTGRGVAVLPGAVLNTGSQLGDGVIVNTNASLDHDCVVGPWAHVAPGVAVAGCARIDEGAFLGVGSAVLPETRVGAWSVVGAGAVVVDDVPAGATVAGVPARPIAARIGDRGSQRAAR